MSREEAIATAAERSRKLVGIVGIDNLAHILAVQPSAVYRWMSLKNAPNDATSERLRVLHECAGVIVDGLDDSHAVVLWLNSPSFGSRTPASEFEFLHVQRDGDRELINSARAFVRSRKKAPRTLVGGDAPYRAAAHQFLELVASSIRAGVLGDRGVDRGGIARIYLRPSEAVEHAERVAAARAQAFGGDPDKIAAGLILLGATSHGGKRTVARRMDGRVVRAWAVPAELIDSVTPLHLSNNG